MKSSSLRQSFPRRPSTLSNYFTNLSSDSILEAYTTNRNDEVSFLIASLIELSKRKGEIQVEDPRYLSLLSALSKHKAAFTTQMLSNVVEALGRLGRKDILSDGYTSLVSSSLEYLGPDVLTVVAKTYAMQGLSGGGTRKIFTTLDERLMEERDTFTIPDLSSSLLAAEIYWSKQSLATRRRIDYAAILSEILASKEPLTSSEITDIVRAMSIACRGWNEKPEGVEELSSTLLEMNECPPQLASAVGSMLDLGMHDKAYWLLRKHLQRREDPSSNGLAFRSTKEAVSLIRVMTRLNRSPEGENSKAWWNNIVDELYMDVVSGFAELNTKQSLWLLHAISRGSATRVCPSKELKKEVVPLLMTEVLREIRTLPPETVAFALRCCVKLQYWDSDFLAGASKVFLDKMEDYPARALSSCLWALTRAGLDSREVAEKAVLCARDRVMEMTPRDATTIIWALARAQFRADAVKYLAPMLSRCIRENNITSTDKAMLLWTIAEHSSDGLLEDPPWDDFSMLAEAITKDLQTALINDEFTNSDILTLLLSYSRLSQCGKSPEDSKPAVLALHRAFYGRVNSLDVSSLCFGWFLIAVSELSDPALQGPIAMATSHKVSNLKVSMNPQDASNVILALQKCSGIDEIEKLVREPLRAACMKAIVDEPRLKPDNAALSDHLLTIAIAGPEALRLHTDEVKRIVAALGSHMKGFSPQQQVRCFMSLTKMLQRHGKHIEYELLEAITEVQSLLLSTLSNTRPKGSDLLGMCWSQLQLNQFFNRSGEHQSEVGRRFLSRLRRAIHHAVEQRKIAWPELCYNIQLLHSSGVFDSLSYEARSELWRSASYRQKKGVPRPEKRRDLLGTAVDPRSGLRGLHKKFRTPAATKHAHFQISENKLVEEKTEPDEEELFDKDRIYGGMQPSGRIPAQSFVEQVRRLKEQERRS